MFLRKTVENLVFFYYSIKKKFQKIKIFFTLRIFIDTIYHFYSALFAWAWAKPIFLLFFGLKKVAKKKRLGAQFFVIFCKAKKAKKAKGGAR